MSKYIARHRRARFAWRQGREQQLPTAPKRPTPDVAPTAVSLFVPTPAASSEAA